MPETFHLDRVDTPTGLMLIVTDGEDRLRAMDWADHEDRLQRLLRRHYREDTLRVNPASGASAAKRALQAYFEGRLDAIETVPTATGGTAFQRKVWSALRGIPAGQTTTYGALAVRLGTPEAVRAVGAANGANPIAIVVPCHRVIGANAALTGYGGGLERKRWLLEHERLHGR